MKCLFLLCLCLVPIVVFSSTFTSQNSIDLPSDATPPTPVLGVTGKELDPRLSYRIISTYWGALGGNVYLGDSPNLAAPCANGVFRYNSDVGPNGTPVRFIPLSSQFGAGICEDEEINVLFNIPIVSCVLVIQFGKSDYDASLRTLLETGGTIGQQDSSLFKIVKSSHVSYNLLYCPLTPFLCPLCPPHQYCAKVGVVSQNGKSRLTLVNDQPFDFYFRGKSKSNK
ncbi:hypothetical protein AABB24_026590 [Solanum stoloniferum]|uniref:Uncharacterized protein n=1 Tax=Solanum stoloniferum TaxID=62892 RepID=A0ABD2SFJ1_9SOLN